MWKAIFTFIRSFASTLTNGMIALNYLAKAGQERALIFQQNSQSVAAIDSVESKARLAKKLKSIQNDKTVTKSDLDAADKFMLDYLETRRIDNFVE